MYGDCTTIGKLSNTWEFHTSEIGTSKNGVEVELFGRRMQKGSPVAHSRYWIVYSIFTMVEYVRILAMGLPTIQQLYTYIT